MSQACEAIAPTEALDDEVQEALELCQGDAIMALRITLIANSFLETRFDELMAQISTGFGRGKVRKPEKIVKKAE